MWLEILDTKLATNFQDLVAKVKILVALAPVLGAILRPADEEFFQIRYLFMAYFLTIVPSFMN